MTAVLGDGGQGSVYLGKGGDGGLVAIKLLHTRLVGDRRAVRRFLAEAATAEKITGEFTARVLSSGLMDERPYMVTEYIEGPSLQDLVTRDGPLPAEALERFCRGTAAALAAIHRAAIVHRDFKPSNVLVAADGPRVIDFGIARTVDSATTATSSVVGTPGYMAPEHIAGETVTAASDMFAWAATMGFAATGTPIFGSDSIPAVMHRILTQEPDLSGVAEPLRSLLSACLAKDPAARPTAEELLQRLAPATVVLEDGDAKPTDRRTRRRRARPASRRKRLLAAGAAALTLAATTTVTLWRMSATGGQQRPFGGQQEPVTVPRVEFGQQVGQQFGPSRVEVSALALGQVGGQDVVAVADAAHGTIELWDPVNADRIAKFDARTKGWVRSVNLTEVNGQTVVVWTGQDGVLRTYRPDSRRYGKWHAYCKGEARSVPGRHQGRAVAFVGCADGRLAALDLNTAQVVGTVRQLSGPVTALAWDGEAVIAGSERGSLVRGNVVQGMGKQIRALSAVGRNKVAVTVGSSTAVHELGRGARGAKAQKTTQSLVSVLNRNGTLLVTEAGNGLRAWMESGEQASLLPAGRQVTAMTLGRTSQGTMVVAGLTDGRLKAWWLDSDQ
ncbi:WD40 repeat domain-containing serine/threonine protein kinase [Nonomuraea sp. NPDC050556]|uniref:WD40 repeat domain-containing serine/threonine protein kinase n=1 Tax=Nonomuraea sp. NPDC050556 TaxID=3364369 RepID=UPI0037AECA95